MPSNLFSPLIFGLLLRSAFASPVSKRDGDYTKLHRIAVNGSSERNGAAAYNYIIAKYGWAAPVSTHEDLGVNRATAPVNEKLAVGGGSGSGSVTATPIEHNSEYLCPVTVGGQTLNVDIDTGSSDLYVSMILFPLTPLALLTSSEPGGCSTQHCKIRPKAAIRSTTRPNPVLIKLCKGLPLQLRTATARRPTEVLARILWRWAA